MSRIRDHDRAQFADADCVVSTVEWAGQGWRVTVTREEVRLRAGTSDVVIPASDASSLAVRRRLLRLSLYRADARLAWLRGLTNHDAVSLAAALRRLAFVALVEDAVAWRADVHRLLECRRAEQRWVTRDEADALSRTRPPRQLLTQMRTAQCDDLFEADERAAARFVDADLTALVRATNDAITSAELTTRRAFFETIEQSPLTEEQARAVVCHDNRVRVVAAAGSGKTSVLVARAAYVVSRGWVPPERILMLAFNAAAAAEMQERVRERCERAGIDATGIRATTFHSFGLSLLGRATGRKPRLAPWMDQGRDVEVIVSIVDELRDASPSFRRSWDLYRLLFAAAPTSLEEGVPDGYDAAARRTGYATLSGQVVKSHGERIVADFLYLNGVAFEYERAYDHDTVDEGHSQYRPDFYYPSIGAWHEHWALDRDGHPPASFVGYADDIAWKRGTHVAHGTDLIETTWADVMFGDGLARLEDELTKRGVTFDWNPDRPARSRFGAPPTHEDLARLVRTFMVHVKSNALSSGDVERRLGGDLARLGGFRTRLFLDLYWPIHERWQQRLAGEGSVDFEDMLVRAADHLEAGEVTCPYELIMVDEFQDASRARVRLVRGLLREPGRHLLAVGDDWQSINRFAGADVSVMTDFDELFGRGTHLALTTSFRCPQVVCDVARRFVTTNPSQLDKPMRSAEGTPPGAVTVLRADDDTRALTALLDELGAAVGDGRVHPGRSGRVSVDVLGRYGFQRDLLARRRWENLVVTFRTMHGAKGLEADYVVVVGVTTGAYGFPSTITDDPVLQLAMPTAEGVAHAEERRLLYVALTRARREVTLLTSPGRVSPFVVELLGDPQVRLVDGERRPVEICTACREGTMVVRSGRYGSFLACSRFPACTNRRPITRRTSPPPLGRGGPSG